MAKRLQGHFRRGDAAQQTMDGLASDQDAITTRLEKSVSQGKLGPKMNEEKDPEYWYAKAEKDGIW